MTPARRAGRPRGEVPAAELVWLESARDRLRAAEGELVAARAELAAQVRHAAAVGGSVRAIADVLETSPARVARILASSGD